VKALCNKIALVFFRQTAGHFADEGINEDVEDKMMIKDSQRRPFSLRRRDKRVEVKK